MKKIKVLMILLLIGGHSINTFSQSSLFSFEKYTNAKGETLQYRQLFSDYDTISKYPLVIFLHGSGERGDDNEAQLKWGAQNFASNQNMKMNRAIVIAPQCPKNTSWGNYSYEDMSLQPTPTKTMELLIELIQETIQNLPVDPNRVYITGLSMGGFGTFDAISRYPDLFAAAVPICGGGDVKKATSIVHIPMWIFHGALDNTVAPELSQNMVKALMEAGGHPGYTQYPLAGHFSWVAAYDDDMMMDWLFSQKK
ncbi:MAG: putative peptidase [Sediminicola sp.]|jgi:predicted peptidase